MVATTPTWSETAITFNAGRPNDVGGTLFDSGTVDSDAYLELDVTGSVIPGTEVFSYHLIPGSTDGVNFRSREASNPPSWWSPSSPAGHDSPRTR